MGRLEERKTICATIYDTILSTTIRLNKSLADVFHACQQPCVDARADNDIMTSLMSTTTTTTHLGNYLRTVRLSRGYTNVNEYLRSYKLPITYVYYREIEIGKRKLGLETAKSLCEALEVDNKAFYYHLLKDILPGDVTEHFKHMLPARQRMSGEELAREKESIDKAYRNSLLNALRLNFNMLEKEAAKYLKDNLDLMPLLWFIHSEAETTESDLEEVARANGIDKPIKKIIEDFQRIGLIEIDQSDKGSKVLRRLFPTIAWRDKQLHSAYLLNETEKTLEQQKQSESADEPTIKYGTVMLTDEQRERVMSRISDLLAELRASNEDASEADSELYYFSVLLASR